MRNGKNQSLWTSVILHVAVLLALFLIVEAFLPKEKPHVFEMISEPSPQDSPESGAPMETPPNFDLPDVKPMADIPDPVLPEPEPVKPRPEPTPVKPTPAPEPPKLMSLDDFRKDNPLKKPKPRPQQQSRQAPPKIDIPKGDWETVSPTVHAPSGRLTQAERTALQRYGDQLNSRLNRAWIKPANLAGVGLTVTVVFDVSRSGRISNIRLRPASGNASFDASVKSAFTRVGSGGVTPTGQAHSFTMSFKMVD